ncbi:MAG: Diadenosine tetraphosphatase [Candidatus Jettenia ecosi]|uniref:Diadenosine tetraphosphatase n=1 Tax=Candidatus Jettenia ecosi TaxID=2494326 RepID=A0A533Q9P2_9BACT|nr:MAG: Diadenosine tetraphosphatase [Candidatus Jettenia ecosi]
MIYGIIGDIHSNYDALTAVINELRLEQVDKILCVGDIIGYAAEPVKCIDLLRELNCISVAGNHDYAVVGKFPLCYFHADARSAVLWTAKQLSDEHVSFLENLPLIEKLEGITLVHGALNHPEFFDYIITCPDAQLNLDILKTPVCFYGHTHVPLGIFLDKEGTMHIERGNVFDLNGAEKAMINVGSVGQPRDWDLRASCAIYNVEEKIVKIKRVKYNINEAVEKIYSAHLPGINALRLREHII